MCKMRWKSIASGSAVLLLLVLAVCVQAQAGVQTGAQEDQGPGEGRPAFAGGQMVRGTVTAIDGDHLTVKTDQGEVYQVAVSANTRVMKERRPLKLADIKPGDGIGAMGVMDAPTKTIHAVFVAVMDADEVRKAREGLGKLYITGKVTAVDMDALKITVLRPDGVSQIIGVDESTSFRRGGRSLASVMNGSGTVEPRSAQSSAADESITLADVKVGDRVMGRGGMKNGVFVPTELGVVDPATMRQRRQRGAGDAGTGNQGASSHPPQAGSGARPQ